MEWEERTEVSPSAEAAERSLIAYVTLAGAFEEGGPTCVAVTYLVHVPGGFHGAHDIIPAATNNIVDHL